MKIYFSELFDDYLFETNGVFLMLVPDSSIDRNSYAWDVFRFTKPTDLKLITEV